MAKVREKQKAVTLRRKGYSIKDIARELSVAPSTVSLWCKSIVLTKSQQRVLRSKQITAGALGRQKGADANREKRLRAILLAEKEASLQIKAIKNGELFYLGLGIYWGEGVKSTSGQTSIINSDVRILKVMIRWFDLCFNIPPSTLRPYVYISNHHKMREKIIMNYWASALGLHLSQFKSPIYLKHRPQERHSNHNTYYGVVALRVPKSTNLKYRILALLNEVSKKLE